MSPRPHKAAYLGACTSLHGRNSFQVVLSSELPRDGLEQPTKVQRNDEGVQSRGTESGTVDAPPHPGGGAGGDADLAPSQMAREVAGQMATRGQPAGPADLDALARALAALTPQQRAALLARLAGQGGSA